MTAPVTALPQHMQALEKANQTRFKRAEYRASVEALSTVDGQARVAELVLEMPPELATLRVMDLLDWIHRVGVSQARRMLRSLGALGCVISEHRALGDLTVRQRKALASYLTGERVGRWAA